MLAVTTRLYLQECDGKCDGKCDGCDVTGNLTGNATGDITGDVKTTAADGTASTVLNSNVGSD